MPSFDEQVEAAAQEEEERKQRLAEANQQDMIRRRQEQEEEENQKRQQSPVQQLKNQAVNQVKQQVKKQVKRAALRFIIATAPYWGPVVGLILLVVVLVGIAVVTPIAICNSGYTDGVTTGVAKTALTASGLCQYLTMDKNTGGASGGGGATGDFALDIVITSAYRPGSIVAGTNRLSAHSRGEAVDIALRNPAVAEGSSDPRIAQLVQIAKSAGFVPAVGDTLDEYTSPTEGASAGHIHVEFNLKSDGTTYCDGARISPPGPTDLVGLGGIPVDASTSDPRVRPCMLTAIQKIFSAAQASP